MSLTLVIARPRARSAADAESTADLRWLRDHLGDGDEITIAYVSTADDAIAAAEQAVEEGRGDVAVVPVRAGNGTSARPDAADMARLPALVRESRDRHPEARVVLVGEVSAPPSVTEVLDLIQPPERDDADLLAQTIQRAFGGDTEQFGRFVERLQRGMPEGTQLGLRGSAVQGFSYKTQKPFDARGPGTSDLDVAVFGEQAMAAWHPEAFVIPGINTLPLADGSTWVAPSLDGARSAAQSIARRPVSLQAMARWFMDLRSGLQRQPYAVIDAR